MTRVRLDRLWVVLLVAAACGDTNRVELSGRSPAQGGMVAADAICKREVTCGSVEISCSGGTNMPTVCSGVISHVFYENCVADVQGDVEQLLSCQSITRQQVDMIEDCVNALANARCPTQ